MTSPSPIVDSLVAEKVRVRKLLRALDRAGVDPKREAALRVPLVRLAECDHVLTLALVLLTSPDIDRPMTPEDAEALHRRAEQVRGEVTDAVPVDARARFDRARDEVAASAAEVWMEVDAARAAVGSAPPRRSDGHAKAERETAEQIAERAWASGHARSSLSTADRRALRAEEAKPLPPASAPLVAWFERLPASWRDSVARLHDLRPSPPTNVAEALAARVADAEWLASYLRDRLGATEREKLAIVLAAGAVLLRNARTEAAQRFAVPWDWSEGLPPTSGGKLRASGLVHVGTADGSLVATVPPPLREVAATALRRVDPEAASAPERVARDVAATAAHGRPFEDPELDRWKRADRALGARFERWALSDRDHFGKAIDLVFRDAPRMLRSPTEQAALFEMGLFDFRDRPGAKTLAERRFAEDRFASEDERALAAATMAARIGVYRAVRTLPGHRLELEPLFPRGPAVTVVDRGLCLTVLPGAVMAFRVYPAGLFHFVRGVTDVIRADRVTPLLRALDRAVSAMGAAGIGSDARDLVRRQPTEVLRILRAHAE